MATLPTINPKELQETLVARIRDMLQAVPVIADHCKVELRERFPGSDAEDILLTTVPDLAQDDLKMTSIIQIGLPTVGDRPYTSEGNRQLTFTYPITYDLSVKDEWDNSDPSNPLEYTHSAALFMAVYMWARHYIGLDITLGFDNCQHEFLQQDNATTVYDEDADTYYHVADWSLTVHVKGVLLQN